VVQIASKFNISLIETTTTTTTTTTRWDSNSSNHRHQNREKRPGDPAELVRVKVQRTGDSHKSVEEPSVREEGVNSPPVVTTTSSGAVIHNALDWY